MAVSNRFILKQLPVIAGLGRVAALSLGRKLGMAPQEVIPPGPEFSAQLEAPSPELVRAYRHHISGGELADGAPWEGQIPAHLFPQWTFPIAGKTLMGVPYPLEKVVNGGCRVEVKGPLPLGEPLMVKAQLLDIKDDGRKVSFSQRVMTGPEAQPDALVVTMRPILVHSKKRSKEEKAEAKAEAKAKSESKAKGPVMTIPDEVRSLGVFVLSKSAGLDFARLTGDFNPIHWIPAYAKASGFPSTILHGFGTMARAWEGLLASEPGAKVKVFDVFFTRPLVLPSSPHLLIDDAGGIYVGEGPGERPYLSGTYELA